MFGLTSPRVVKAPSTSLTAKNNPYKAQREWPPDFKKLNHIQQFRLERRYRRRAKLRYQRPGWIRGVKLATWGSCSCQSHFVNELHGETDFSHLVVAVYGVLFMDWGPDVEPFEGVCKILNDMRAMALDQAYVVVDPDPVPQIHNINMDN